jgi:hypothetical protein
MRLSKRPQENVRKTIMILQYSELRRKELDKLRIRIEKIERDQHYLYVSDSFKPQLRKTKHFIKVKRILATLRVTTMPPNERNALNNLLGIKTTNAFIAYHNL